MFKDTPALLFKGASIAVRLVKKQSGNIRYGLYRPWDKKKSVIDEFDSLQFANLLAAYINAHGGNMDKVHYRKAMSEITRCMQEHGPKP